MEQGKNNRVRFLIILAFIIGAALVVGGIMSTMRSKGRIPVEFITAPKQAKITLSGRSVGHTTSVTPGTYQVEVSYDGFSTYSNTLVVRPDSGKVTQPVELSAQTDEAKKIAASQTAQYQSVEKAGGQLAAEAGQDLLDQNPIVRFLPVRTSFYSIEYGKDNDVSFKLIIIASAPAGRQVALQKIHDLGFDPTDFIIEYRGLNNPFGQPSLKEVK